jgi:nitrate reductase gamma subunit
MRSKSLLIASNLFHVGVLFILAGHLVGLLTPEAIYHHVISTPNKQLLAMVSGGLFGIICFVGLTMLLHRRITDERVKATGSRGDLAVLILLYIQLILGLSTIVVSSSHMDGSVMVLLATWAQSIATFQPLAAADAIRSVHILYKLHVFFGLTIVLVVPFTRLVHIISAPVWYLGRRYQIVRQKSAW